MAKLHINLGDAPNDRTGDPLRTAFEKVNSNFDELYARTGDDIQIPALAGNNGKVLTTNGTTLSWLLSSTNKLVNGVNEVVLGTDGKLTLPGTGTINNVSGAGASFTATTPTGISGDTKEFAVGGDVDTVTTSWTATGGGIVGTANITNVNIGLSFTFITFNQTFTATGPITFSGPGGASSLELTPDGTTAWAFSSDGTLSSPNGLLQRNTAPVNCQGNASTVVYTSADTGIQTIKLLIQTEGIEGVGSIMDTQSCEMIVAKSFRANDIAASVYGIVYTSQAPLATFTADWNGLTSRIEVLCTTPGANNVNVKIFATEITTSD